MSSNPFRDTLVAAGITSGSQLAERMGSPAVIYFLAKKGSRPCADLEWWDDKGVQRISTHWSDLRVRMGEARRTTVEAARQEARERLGLEEWSKTPFSNCWLPSNVLRAARERFPVPTETD